MLVFADAPYSYFPPRPQPWIMSIAGFVNRVRALPGPNHRLLDYELQLDPAWQDCPPHTHQRLLYLPNHSTHSDAQMAVEMHRQLKTPSMFMAAYDVFLRSRITAWVMQRTGCFSVDREGSDSQAMKQAMQSLVDGRFALTIFPEGNVYLMNDRITPFLEGAAFIAMKAQKDLGPDKPIMAVPVSMKTSHLTDVSDTVCGMLDALAAEAGTTFDREADPVDELIRIGLTLLSKNLRQRGHLPKDSHPEGLPALLKESALPIIESLEGKMDLKVRPNDSLIDRFRKVRRSIHQIRIDPEQSTQHSVAAAWSDEATLALRILSYGGDYLVQHPTLDRFAETVEKLTEDLHSELVKPIGPRKAIVRVNAPINLAEYLDAFSQKARPVLQDLTARFEESVQNGLDEINKTNTLPGSKLFAVRNAAGS
jgi:1-acyl-sn-glycerol-3-phosphate acyltransferase